jgi:hypothetical protein
VLGSTKVGGVSKSDRLGDMTGWVINHVIAQSKKNTKEIHCTL